MAHGREDWREHDAAAEQCRNERIVRPGPRRGGVKSKPTTPKPDVAPPGQRSKRYAKAVVERERIDVGKEMVISGHLMGKDLVCLENICIYEVLQDEWNLAGRSDSEGVVTGKICGRISTDGGFSFNVEEVPEGAFLLLDYEYQYEVPGGCDNFGCQGHNGSMVCPECRDEHFMLLRKERDELREQVEQLEQQIVTLTAERDQWETKYRMS